MNIQQIFEKYDQEEVREYLNGLRDSGQVNMFGAGEYLERMFGMNRREGKEREIRVVHKGKETDYIHDNLETAVLYHLAQTYAPKSIDDAAWAAGIILNMWGHPENE